MKVEELYLQEKQNQVGVTLQRVLFETEIDIFPCLNPLEEAGWSGDDTVMSDLMSAQTEEKICQVIKHQTGEGDDEFLTIPLKRIDSSPHQHNLQDMETARRSAAAREAECRDSSSQLILRPGPALPYKALVVWSGTGNAIAFDIDAIMVA
ncbi:uncharacterized protein LOC124363741 [Homalodisca vitripennis]|uniref:uncharacterized protein LOC124363741 n=1 Tax=Homalodisca vitripennis TaxID=197043 RepID=UPI001EECE460|nr:uncharacterized protein LOC124363741 [Homalodisca vitripennis]